MNNQQPKNNENPKKRKRKSILTKSQINHDGLATPRKSTRQEEVNKYDQTKFFKRKDKRLRSNIHTLNYARSSSSVANHTRSTGDETPGAPKKDSVEPTTHPDSCLLKCLENQHFFLLRKEKIELEDLRPEEAKLSTYELVHSIKRIDLKKSIQRIRYKRAFILKRERTGSRISSQNASVSGAGEAEDSKVVDSKISSKNSMTTFGSSGISSKELKLMVSQSGSLFKKSRTFFFQKFYYPLNSVIEKSNSTLNRCIVYNVINSGLLLLQVALSYPYLQSFAKISQNSIFLILSFTLITIQLARIFLGYREEESTNKLRNVISKILRGLFFNKIMASNETFLSMIEKSHIIKVIYFDNDYIKNFITKIPRACSDLLTLCWALIASFLMLGAVYSLVLFMMILGYLVAYVVLWRFSKSGKKRRYNQMLSSKYWLFEEFFKNIRSIKVMNLEKLFYSKFDRIRGEEAALLSSINQVNCLMNTLKTAFPLLGFLVFLGVLRFSGEREMLLEQDEDARERLLLFLIILGVIKTPLENLTNCLNLIKNVRLSLNSWSLLFTKVDNYTNCIKDNTYNMYGKATRSLQKKLSYGDVYIKNAAFMSHDPNRMVKICKKIFNSSDEAKKLKKRENEILKKRPKKLEEMRLAANERRRARNATINQTNVSIVINGAVNDENGNNINLEQNGLESARPSEYSRPPDGTGNEIALISPLSQPDQARIDKKSKNLPQVPFSNFRLSAHHEVLSSQKLIRAAQGTPDNPSIPMLRKQRTSLKTKSNIMRSHGILPPNPQNSPNEAQGDSQLPLLSSPSAQQDRIKFQSMYEMNLERELPSSNLHTILNSNIIHGSGAGRRREECSQYSEVQLEDVDETVLMKIELRHITFEFFSGQRICICGDPGSGKEKFIKGLIGEFKLNEGVMILKGKICYVQMKNPIFMEGESLMHNILFGEVFNSFKYYDILRLVGLDLNSFKYGDETEILENGKNLSKHEVEKILLARALYSECDIYMFDTFLDDFEKFERVKICKKIFFGHLRNKTIIYTSNREELIEHSDFVILFHKGRIYSARPFEDMKRGPQCPVFNKVVIRKSAPVKKRFKAVINQINFMRKVQKFAKFKKDIKFYNKVNNIFDENEHARWLQREQDHLMIKSKMGLLFQKNFKQIFFKNSVNLNGVILASFLHKGKFYFLVSVFLSLLTTAVLLVTYMVLISVIFNKTDFFIFEVLELQNFQASRKSSTELRITTFSYLVALFVLMELIKRILYTKIFEKFSTEIHKKATKKLLGTKIDWFDLNSMHVPLNFVTIDQFLIDKYLTKSIQKLTIQPAILLVLTLFLNSNLFCQVALFFSLLYFFYILSKFDRVTEDLSKLHRRASIKLHKILETTLSTSVYLRVMKKEILLRDYFYKNNDVLENIQKHFLELTRSWMTYRVYRIALLVFLSACIGPLFEAVDYWKFGLCFVLLFSSVSELKWLIRDYSSVRYFAGKMASLLSFMDYKESIFSRLNRSVSTNPKKSAKMLNWAKFEKGRKVGRAKTLTGPRGSGQLDLEARQNSERAVIVELKYISIKIEDHFYLQNINFRVEQGQRIAIVSDRQTKSKMIFGILLGLLDINPRRCLTCKNCLKLSRVKDDENKPPECGNTPVLKLFDLNMNHKNFPIIRKKVAYLTESPILLRGTILDNIDPYHKYNPEDIKKVLSRLRLIEALGLMKVKRAAKKTVIYVNSKKKKTYLAGKFQAVLHVERLKKKALRVQRQGTFMDRDEDNWAGFLDKDPRVLTSNRRFYIAFMKLVQRVIDGVGMDPLEPALGLKLSNLESFEEEMNRFVDSEDRPPLTRRADYERKQARSLLLNAAVSKVDDTIIETAREDAEESEKSEMVENQLEGIQLREEKPGLSSDSSSDSGSIDERGISFRELKPAPQILSYPEKKSGEATRGFKATKDTKEHESTLNRNNPFSGELMINQSQERPSGGLRDSREERGETEMAENRDQEQATPALSVTSSVASRTPSGSREIISEDQVIDEFLQLEVKKDFINVDLGLRKLVLMARVMLEKPEIVLIDENALRFNSADVVYNLEVLKTFLPRKTTLICLTNELKLCIKFTKTMVLQRGEITGFDTCVKLLNDNGYFFSRFKREDEKTFNVLSQTLEFLKMKTGGDNKSSESERGPSEKMLVKSAKSAKSAKNDTSHVRSNRSNGGEFAEFTEGSGGTQSKQIRDLPEGNVTARWYHKSANLWNLSSGRRNPRSVIESRGPEKNEEGGFWINNGWASSRINNNLGGGSTGRGERGIFKGGRFGRVGAEYPRKGNFTDRRFNSSLDHEKFLEGILDSQRRKAVGERLSRLQKKVLEDEFSMEDPDLAEGDFEGGEGEAGLQHTRCIGYKRKSQVMGSGVSTDVLVNKDKLDVTRNLGKALLSTLKVDEAKKRAKEKEEAERRSRSQGRSLFSTLKKKKGPKNKNSGKKGNSGLGVKDEAGDKIKPSIGYKTSSNSQGRPKMSALNSKNTQNSTKMKPKEKSDLSKKLESGDQDEVEKRARSKGRALFATLKR